MMNLIKSKRPLLRFPLLAVTLLTTVASADRPHTDAVHMREVLDIARGIIAVQPFLPNAKYIEYALGIYRASQRYQIEPGLLIAITQQESGFRDNLPEGKAGEIGVCQILKHWRDNPRFRAEFGDVTITDMKRSASSFLYAAWILKGLREESAHSALPYWSYYNSTQFKNRLKYYLHVNKRLALLRQKAPDVYHLSPPAQTQMVAVRETASNVTAVAAAIAPAPTPARTTLSAAEMAKLLTASASVGGTILND